MNDKTATVLVVLFFSALIGVPIGLCIAFSVHSDQAIITEGEVIDMKVEGSGHFLGGNEYYLQLNTSIKWYEITKSQYYMIDIGDYIIMYASNRIEVKGS